MDLRRTQGGQPMTLRDKLADAIHDAIDNVHDMDVTFDDYAQASADAVISVISESVEPLKQRLSDLDGLCANAERSGPSAPGYVTDATFNVWCGQRSGIREALRTLSALGLPAPEQEKGG